MMKRVVSFFFHIVVLFGGCWVTIYCCETPPSLLKMCFCIISVLFISAVLLNGAYHILRKRCGRVLGFLGLFAFGAYLYQYYYTYVDDPILETQKNKKAEIVGEDEVRFVRLGGDVFRIFNMTTGSFFSSRGSYENFLQAAQQGKTKFPDNVDHELHYFLFHVFNWLMYLYVAGVAISFLGRESMQRLRLFVEVLSVTVGLKKYINVFYCQSNQSFCLADSIASDSKRKNNDVVFLLPKQDFQNLGELKSEIDKIDERGWMWQFFDFQKLSKTLLKCQNHFFLGDDCFANIKNVTKLFESLSDKDTKKLKVFVRVDEALNGSVLGDWIKKLREKVDLRIVSEQTIVANQFIHDFPMISSYGVEVNPETRTVNRKEQDGEKFVHSAEELFSVLQIGFGWLGQELLKTIIPNAQFINTNIKVDIVDRDENAFTELKCFCKVAIAEYHITPHVVDVCSSAFAKCLRNNIGRYNRIIISLGSDALNLKVAELVRDAFKEQGLSLKKNIVYVRLRNRDVASAFSSLENSPLSFFGSIDKIYTRRVIVDEIEYDVAKHLNAVWSGKDDVDVDEEWHKATFFNQESSLASAAGQRNLLNLLGFELKTDGLSDEGGKLVSFKEVADALCKNVELLAEMEHLRWNAFHLLRGINCWNLRRPIPLHRVTVIKANQIEIFKRHASICDFASLPGIDAAIVKENYHVLLDRKTKFAEKMKEAFEKVENKGSLHQHTVLARMCKIEFKRLKLGERERKEKCLRVERCCEFYDDAKVILRSQLEKLCLLECAVLCELLNEFYSATMSEDDKKGSRKPCVSLDLYQIAHEIMGTSKFEFQITQKEDVIRFVNECLECLNTGDEEGKNKKARKNLLRKWRALKARKTVRKMLRKWSVCTEKKKETKRTPVIYDSKKGECQFGGNVEILFPNLAEKGFSPAQSHDYQFVYNIPNIYSKVGIGIFKK